MNLVVRSILAILSLASLFIGFTAVGISSALTVAGAPFAAGMTGALFIVFGVLGFVALRIEKVRATA